MMIMVPPWWKIVHCYSRRPIYEATCLQFCCYGGGNMFEAIVLLNSPSTRPTRPFLGGPTGDGNVKIVHPGCWPAMCLHARSWLRLYTSDGMLFEAIALLNRPYTGPARLFLWMMRGLAKNISIWDGYRGLWFHGFGKLPMWCFLLWCCCHSHCCCLCLRLLLLRWPCCLFHGSCPTRIDR